MSRIRVLALCVFRDGERILVGRGEDPMEERVFYRPLGGEVEFGETAVQALRREVREELGVEIERPTRLGVLENIFTYRGRPGHELVIVFDARFANPTLYGAPTIPLREDHWGGEAVWLDLRRPPADPLYPSGLIGLVLGSIG